jgi:hypothetical protein
MGFTVRCSGAAVWCFWRVEAETQSEGLGLGRRLGFVVAPSCGCMGSRRPPLSGLTRSCVLGHSPASYMGHSPASYTGRPSGLVGLAVLSRVVP